MSDKIIKPPPISSSKESNMEDSHELHQDLWKVSETLIKPISPFHPPMDAKCVTFVNETNGSIITNRIANCLRELSIVVEYGDTNAKANAMTKEYVRFTIELYRSKSSDESTNNNNNRGIIVECTRIRGDVRIFHKICRIVLNASKGIKAIIMNDGSSEITNISSLGHTKKPAAKARRIDDRSRSSSIDKPSFLSSSSSLLPSFSSSSSRPSLVSSSTSSKSSIFSSSSSSSPSTTSSSELGLEIAWSLLKKDRLDANLLGMESLVYLTDVHVADKLQTVLVSSYAVLGIDPSTMLKKGNDSAIAVEIEDFTRFMDIHYFIISLIRDKKFTTNMSTNNNKAFIFPSISDDEDGNDMISSSNPNNDNIIEENNIEIGDKLQDSKNDKDESDDDDDDEDQLNDNTEHISKMRSLAYQILLNSLQVIASTNQTNTASYQLAYTNLIITNQILPSILSEITKTYACSSGLNAHDATLAIQILHLLLVKQKQDEQNQCDIITNETQKMYLQKIIQKAYKVGCARHELLQSYCSKLLLFLDS